MFRSATFKLTLWYLAIVMAISLMFSLVLYHLAGDELARGLHRETDRIYNQFPVFNGNPLLRPTDDINNGTHRILLQLIGFNAVVLLAAGFASYFLARRTLQPIEEAHEQQKRFTADVSHELRTPLTAIRMESEVALLNKRSSANELRDVLDSNLEEVGKLESLINNLLRLTRLEADEVRQNFTSVHLESITAAAVSQVATIAADHNITLTNNASDAIVSGDAASLTQLLIILLDNAVKYSPAGSTVEIGTTLSGGSVQINVIDQGVGIKKAALEHVFDRFYRSDTSRAKTTTDTAGYGLGLSIAKMIADIHDASITLTSSPGKGTTARLTLQIAAKKNEKSTKPAA